MYCRRLKSGNWLVGAGNSVPIVLDRAAIATCSAALQIAEREQIFSVQDLERKSVAVKDSTSWKICFWGLWGVGAVSFVAVIFAFIRLGFPSGVWWAATDSFWSDLLYVAAIAIFTAPIHEFGHLFFGQTHGVVLHWSKFTVTTNLNHTWSWPIFYRISAVSAGMIIDVIFLALLFLTYFQFRYPIILSVCSTICLRVIWQFGFHGRRDGRYLASFLADNPLLFTNPSKARITLVFVGILVDIFLLLWWPLVFIIELYL